MLLRQMYYQITLVSLSALHVVTYSLNLFDGIPANNLTLFVISCVLLICFSLNLMYATLRPDFVMLKAFRRCLIMIIVVLFVVLAIMYLQSPTIFVSNKIIILLVCLFYFALEAVALTLFIADCDIPADDEVCVPPSSSMPC